MTIDRKKLSYDINLDIPLLDEEFDDAGIDQDNLAMTATSDYSVNSYETF